jgi:hypothetical protein
MSAGDLSTGTPVTGWEYTLIDFDLATLNEMASHGWRLVQVVDAEVNHRNKTMIIMERALPGVTG